MNGVTVDQAIDRLNELYKLDPEAMHSLITTYFPASQGLADHPTCQVNVHEDKHVVSMIGIINGIFGADKDGDGLIAARFTTDPFDEEHKSALVGFCRYIKKKKKETQP